MRHAAPADASRSTNKPPHSQPQTRACCVRNVTCAKRTRRAVAAVLGLAPGGGRRAGGAVDGQAVQRGAAGDPHAPRLPHAPPPQGRPQLRLHLGRCLSLVIASEPRSPPSCRVLRVHTDLRATRLCSLGAPRVAHAPVIEARGLSGHVSHRERLIKFKARQTRAGSASELGRTRTGRSLSRSGLTRRAHAGKRGVSQQPGQGHER